MVEAVDLVKSGDGAVKTPCHPSGFLHRSQHIRGMAVCQTVPNPQKYPLFSKDIGAVEKTRTSTAFRPQRPQRCASTSSATTAHKRLPDKPASGRPVPQAKRIGQSNKGKRRARKRVV